MKKGGTQGRRRQKRSKKNIGSRFLKRIEAIHQEVHIVQAKNRKNQTVVSKKQNFSFLIKNIKLRIYHLQLLHKADVKNHLHNPNPLQMFKNPSVEQVEIRRVNTQA